MHVYTTGLLLCGLHWLHLATHSYVYSGTSVASQLAVQKQGLYFFVLLAPSPKIKCLCTPRTLPYPPPPPTHTIIPALLHIPLILALALQMQITQRPFLPPLLNTLIPQSIKCIPSFNKLMMQSLLKGITPPKHYYTVNQEIFIQDFMVFVIFVVFNFSFLYQNLM